MNLRPLAYAASIGSLLVLQPYRPYVVDGLSMAPTYASGQWVVGDSRPEGIARDEVVVFRHGSETMIKRVAYLPGDRIERYRFLDEWIVPTSRLMRESLVRQGHPRRDYVVPPGQIFVVGDNYTESVDSRTYGAVDLQDVLAAVPEAPACDDPWSAPAHTTAAAIAQL